MFCVENKYKNIESCLMTFHNQSIVSKIVYNYKFSIKEITTFKNSCEKFLKKDLNKFSLILFGSYGRLESSEHSDIDYCLIFDDSLKKCKQNKISKFIKKNSKHIFGNTKISPFLETSYKNILKNIGGDEDLPKNFTTRVLILLEGIPLNNDELYEKLINELFENYLEEFIREKKFPLFLTNEIIRYWRTLCIDYRWKKIEGDQKWGLRNIKLRFSRKILCFSAIMLLCLLYKGYIKLEKCKEYICSSPSSRLINLYNFFKDNKPVDMDVNVLDLVEKIILKYNDFLSEINNINIRESLEKVIFKDRNENIHYSNLKQKAHDFHNDLIKLVKIIDKENMEKYLII